MTAYNTPPERGDYLEGFAVIPRAIQRDPDITWQEKAVYVALSSRANAAQQCWPSLATIAKDASISESTARRAREKLRERGLLSWVPDPDGKPGSTVCIYTLGSGGGVSVRHPGGVTETAGGCLTDQQMMQVNDATKDTAPLALVPDPQQQEPQGWDAWWKMYPRHSPGPSAAVVKKKYVLALRAATPAAILEGLQRDVAAWEAARTQKRHIPMATTWLTQERWAAEVDDDTSGHAAAGEWWLA